MAVRFLPPPEERGAAPREDRADLAEVIELRARISQWNTESDGDARDETEGETEVDTETAAEVEARGSAAEGSASARSCAEDGVRILARRARSSGELRQELARLEHEPHEVETVIDEFERNHYLDDAGLARLLTEKLRDTKRASRAQIRAKLRDRRLPDDVIEAAVGELDTDEEFALLREAAADRARKLGGLDRQTAERRLLGFLARRGWSGEPAMRAAREALDGAAGPRSVTARGSSVRFTR